MGNYSYGWFYIHKGHIIKNGYGNYLSSLMTDFIIQKSPYLNKALLDYHNSNHVKGKLGCSNSPNFCFLLFCNTQTFEAAIIISRKNNNICFSYSFWVFSSNFPHWDRCPLCTNCHKLQRQATSNLRTLLHDTNASKGSIIHHTSKYWSKILEMN